jgi:hypothetical protein
MIDNNKLTAAEQAELDELNRSGLTADEQAELDELNGVSSVKKKAVTSPSRLVSGTSVSTEKPSAYAPQSLSKETSVPFVRPKSVSPAPELPKTKSADELVAGADKGFDFKGLSIDPSKMPTTDLSEADVLSNQRKEREEFLKPEAVKKADKKILELDDEIVNVSRSLNDVRKSQEINIKTLQDLKSQIENPSTPEDVKAQLTDVYNKTYDNALVNDASEKEIKNKAVDLQRSKSTLKKVYEVQQDLEMNRDDDTLKAAGNFLSHVYNATAPSVVSGIGAVVESAGDIGAVGPVSTVYESFKKGAGDNKITDIIGDALQGMGKDMKTEINEKYSDKHYISSTIGDITGSIITAALPGGAVSSAGKVASLIASSTASAMQMADDVHTQAKDAGLSDADAGMMTLSVTPLMGLVDAWGAGNIIDNIAGKKMLKELITESVKKLSKGEVTKDVIFKTVGDTFKTVGEKYGINMAKSATEEGIAEGLQAEIEAGSENLYDVVNGKESYGTKIFSAEEQLNVAKQAAMGAVAGGSLGVLSGISSPKNIYQKAMSLKDNPSKLAEFQSMLEAETKAGHITPEQTKNIANNITSMLEADKKIPSQVTNVDKRFQAIELIKEKNNIQSEMMNVDPSMAAPLKSRLNEINSDLELIAKGTERVSMKRAPFEAKIQEKAIADIDTQISAAQSSMEGKTETEKKSIQDNINKLTEQKNAIQKQSTGGLLQPETGRAGEPGGKRGTLEQGVEGAEAATEGKTFNAGAKKTVAGVELIEPSEKEHNDLVAERNTPEWTQKEVAKLEESDAIDIAEIEKKANADEDFAILTGTNPEGKAHTDAENASLQEKAVKWLEEKGYKPKKVVGKYGQGEASLFVDGMTLEDAAAFRKEFQQESVAHSKAMVYDGKYIKRVKANDDFNIGDFKEDTDSATAVRQTDGTTKGFKLDYDWGKYKPIKEIITEKTQAKPEPLTKSEKAKYDILKSKEKRGKATDADKANIAKYEEKIGQEVIIETTKGNIENIKSSLSDIAAGIKIETHNTPDSFSKAAEEAGANAQDSKDAGGFFDPETNTIHLNLEKIKSNTLFHEGIHPILNAIEAINPGVINKLFNQVVEAEKRLGIEGKYSKEFAGRYDEAQQKMEAITEFIADISDGKIEITPSNFDKIKQIFIDLMKAVGIDVSDKIKTIDDLLMLSDKISSAFETGSVIKIGEINPANIDKAAKGENPLVKAQFSINEAKLPVVNLADLFKKYGNKMIAINSDPTKVGKATLPSGRVIELFGGVKYVGIKGNVEGQVGFAASKFEKVKILNKLAKETFKDTNGEGVVLIVAQKPDSLLGNYYSLQYALDAIKMLPKSILNSSAFKKEFFGKDIVAIKEAFGSKYDAFYNKYKNKEFKKDSDIDELINDLMTNVGNSFEARKSLVRNLLGGIVEKSARKGHEGEKGFISKTPVKYIAKELYSRLKINQESLFRELGQKELIDDYFDNGGFGSVAAGFIHDSKADINEVQKKGIEHPQFNSKFHGKDAFLTDQLYNINELMPAKTGVDKSGKPFSVSAYTQVAGSMYPKGEVVSVEKAATGRPGIQMQKPKKGDDLVEKAGKRKEMTEDDKGNYLFFHYSNAKFNKLNPEKVGKHLATSRGETPAKKMSMLYTRPDRLEPGVPSENGYVVRVPKNKVYHFNSDALNLLPEAEKLFRKENGKDKSFDLNNQVAYVAKVAARKGFPVTTSDWNIKGTKALRAQTTEVLPVEKYSNIKPGTTNQVQFNPEFENVKPNAKRRGILYSLEGESLETALDRALEVAKNSSIEEGLAEFKESEYFKNQDEDIQSELEDYFKEEAGTTQKDELVDKFDALDDITKKLDAGATNNERNDLRSKRNAIFDENPELKEIYFNFSKITKKLEEKGDLKKSRPDCP